MPAPDELLPQLLACHDRIRRFTDLAGRLADEPAATPEELGAAAESVLRYFSIALPLHVADEDDSIAPRLVAIGSRDLRWALRVMEVDHAIIERAVKDALPVWAAVASAPHAIEQHRTDLAESAARLKLLLPPHLAAEETLIFPELPRLGRETLAEIRAEQRERRKAAP